MTREQAYERLRAMSTHDCINYWNDNAVDHYCRLWRIYAMSDLVAWNGLARELGAWDLIQAVLNAGEHFNDSDMFFFYDVECNHIRSFNTKQELLEQVGEDFFIVSLTNEE